MDDSPAERCVAELERCVNELGFVGCLLNPDPTEGDGPAPPGLGDPFWYPLYDAMTELDVPALIHSAGSCNAARVVHAEVHQRREHRDHLAARIEGVRDVSEPEDRRRARRRRDPLPDGPLPFVGARARAPQTFDEQLRKLYFDTCNYSKDAIELLLKVAGTDNVLFGTEKPGTGSARDPIIGPRLRRHEAGDRKHRVADRRAAQEHLRMQLHACLHACLPQLQGLTRQTQYSEKTHHGNDS